MMTLLSFMEKIYADTKTLSMIYIIGSILLFIFIILLIFSLRKPANKKTKIIDEPNIDNNESKEKVNEELKEVVEVQIEEKQEETVKEETEKQEEKKNLEDILNITEQKEETIVDDEKSKAEVRKEEINNISSEIPSIDDYVDNIVNKTYEKNEQFSSVYVNTDTIKLEKVLDKLNVDEDIKEEIVPEEEKIQKEELKIEETVKETENKLDVLKTALEEKKYEENSNLDKLENLKKSLEEKTNSVKDKQDDLKNKLAALNNNNVNKLDDLKNKLDNLKNQ